VTESFDSSDAAAVRCNSPGSANDENQFSEIDLRSVRHSGHKDVEYFLGIMSTETGRPVTTTPRKPSERPPAVYFAGTETATTWIGYMDGAVESARRAACEVMWSL
jgi:monoamine oxidase